MSVIINIGYKRHKLSKNKCDKEAVLNIRFLLTYVKTTFIPVVLIILAFF